MKQWNKPYSQDPGAEPMACNVRICACKNKCFRTAFWTGCYGQMTLMSILPRQEIGKEIHEDTDQMIRIEEGVGLAEWGCALENKQRLQPGDVFFVPAGTWHNVRNIGHCALKLSSIYAPPNHPKGVVECEKKETY
ncbi:MAG: cupin domain-containing protein [Lachnospiraceae bacterium]